jgi:hypothetical protein
VALLASRDVLRTIRRPDAPLFVLLFTWALSLCAPALHARFDVEAGSGEASHGDGDHGSDGGRGACDAAVVHHDGAVVHADCTAGDHCRDPSHHHHAPYQHDATRCPACASSLERASELPSFRFSSPRRVFVAAVASVRVPTPAERHVFALARAPPSSGGSTVGACGIG